MTKMFRHITNKTQYFRQNIVSMLCIFLIGFLNGNLFGTILTYFRSWMVWDGFIILGLLLTIEVISYFSYKSPNKLRSTKFINRIHCKTGSIQNKFSFKNKSHKFARVFWKNLNFFKIGIMIGFFVDAFKVGS